MQTHKVLKNVRYLEEDEKNGTYIFKYEDFLNLMKKGDKIGVYSILDNNK